MIMLSNIYRWLLRLTSRPGEKGKYSGGYLQNKVRQEALALCRRIKGRALEIGCGEGLFISQLAKQTDGLDIWGVDNNESRLKVNAGRLRNIHLLCQDAVRLSFEDGYFDVVISVNVFFNMASIEDVRQALSEMKRVCKKGGNIIFDFRNSMNLFFVIKYKLANFYDDTLKELPLRTYHPRQIESILKALEFKITQKRFIGFPWKRFAPIIIIEAQKI